MTLATEVVAQDFNIETDLPDPIQLEAYFKLHENQLSSISEINRAYINETVPNEYGHPVKIVPGAIALDQGHLLFYLTRKIMPRVTLEAGFGFGMSACFMLAAHKLNNIGSVHVSIDPHFRGWTKGVGIYTLQRLNLADSHYLIEENPVTFCRGSNCPKTPRRFRSRSSTETISLIFALVDFFYIDRLTRTQGLIVFDDVSSPALTALVNFITTNRKDYRFVRPNPRTIICQKIGTDQRSWDHFRPFQGQTGHDWDHNPVSRK